MLKILVGLSIIIASLSSKSEATEFIGPTADTITIALNNKGLLEIILKASALYNSGDSVDIEISDTVSPAFGKYNQDIPLNKKLTVHLKQLDFIAFKPYCAQFNFYPDTTIYKLTDLDINHSNVFSRHSSVDSLKAVSYITYYNNKLTWYADTLYNGSELLLAAVNILKGIVNENRFPESTFVSWLVPKKDSAIFMAGTKLFSEITANGLFKVLGSASNPVFLGGLILAGDGDSSFSKNRVTSDITFANIQGISSSFTNLIIKNSFIGHIDPGNFSQCILIHDSLYSMQPGGAKVLVDSCRLVLEKGYFSCANSIVTIQNSTITDKSSSEYHAIHSFIGYIKNRMEIADVWDFTSPQNSFLYMDGNVIINRSTGSSNAPIQIWSGNYAIICRNIIEGFSTGVDIGYNNSAIIFNNTFVNNAIGIRTYGMIDSCSISNNILCNTSSFTSIDLSPSSIEEGKNQAYIANNLNYNGYLSSSSNTQIVSNSGTVVNDPCFLDSINFELCNLSPAIDKGTTNIKMFGCNFSVLDTTISIFHDITISGFAGLAPDIGAKEKNGTIVSLIDRNNLNQFKNASGAKKAEVYDISGRKLGVLKMLGQTIEKPNWIHAKGLYIIKTNIYSKHILLK